MSNTKKKYLDGVFIKKTWSDGDKLLLSVGMNKNEVIKNLQALPADSRGFINFSMGQQLTDKNKYSIWLDEYERPTPPANLNAPSISDDDSLPF